MSKLKCQYSNRTFAYTYSKEHTGLHRNDNDLYLNSFMYHPYPSMTYYLAVLSPYSFVKLCIVLLSFV